MTSPAAGEFYQGAEQRIFRWLALLALAGTLIALAIQRWAFAGGFVAGAALGGLNLGWLKSAVSGMVDRMVAAGVVAAEPPKSRTTAAKFLLRYGLIALVTYVILNSSALSIYGFIAGLLLPVAALMCEAGYEAYVALRRGI